MSNTVVWFKIKERLTFDVAKYYEYWRNLFIDPKYKCYLYSENVNTNRINPKYLENTTIVDRSIINKKCGIEIFQMMGKGKVAPNWKPAGFALAAPYYYLADSGSPDDIIVNVDADDMFLGGDSKYYMEKAIDLVASKEANTLSYDLNFSHHVIFSRDFKHHWSFGINVGRKQFMMDTIKSASENKNIHTAPWGNNMDHLVGEQLKSMNEKYLAFITEEGLYHSSSEITDKENLDAKSHFIKYNSAKNIVDIKLRNQQLDPQPLHSKTIFIKGEK